MDPWDFKGIKIYLRVTKKETSQSTFTIFHLFTFMPFKFLPFTFLAIYFLHFIIVVLLYFSSIMLPWNTYARVKQFPYITILRKCFSKSISPFPKRMTKLSKKKRRAFPKDALPKIKNLFLSKKFPKKISLHSFLKNSKKLF